MKKTSTILSVIAAVAALAALGAAVYYYLREHGYCCGDDCCEDEYCDCGCCCEDEGACCEEFDDEPMTFAEDEATDEPAEEAAPAESTDAE